MESPPNAAAAGASSENESDESQGSSPQRSATGATFSILNFFSSPPAAAAPPPAAATSSSSSSHDEESVEPPVAAAAAAASTSASSSEDRKRSPEELESDAATPRRSERVKKLKAELKKPPPGAKVESDDEEDDGDKKPAAREGPAIICAVCLSDVKKHDVSVINGCEHKFCFKCIEEWADTQNTCPLCKKRFTKIDRVCKKRVKGRKKMKFTKKVKTRTQKPPLMEVSALYRLAASINGGGIAIRGAGSAVGESNNAVPLALSQIMGLTLTSGLGMPSAGSAASSAGSSTAAGIAGGVGTASSPFELVDSDDESPSSSVPPAAAASAAAPTRPRRHPGSVTGFHVSHRHVRRHRLSGLGPRHPNEIYLRSGGFTDLALDRSHASNANDANAGNEENPFEIDLEDNDDDVQVIATRVPVRSPDSSWRNPRRSGHLHRNPRRSGHSQRNPRRSAHSESAEEPRSESSSSRSSSGGQGGSASSDEPPSESPSRRSSHSER